MGKRHRRREEHREEETLPVPTPILLDRTSAPPPEPPRAVVRPIQLDNVAGGSAVAVQPAPPSVPLASPRAAPFTPADSVYTGAVLKRAREARGISLEQICERTRIPRMHLLNLEADRYELLPPGVYLRGMLLSLAKELRLDGQKVARSYMEASTAATQGRPH